MAASATTCSHRIERIKWKKTFPKPTEANTMVKYADKERRALKLRDRLDRHREGIDQ